MQSTEKSVVDKGSELLSKVPEVTIFFWVIKILCTTVGETASDFLNVNLRLGLVGTSIVTGILLLVSLVFQFRAKRYVPGIYWVTVVMISVFGTLVTDNLTDGMGVPLETSTLVFSALLALTFRVWYAYEKTLSIHSVYTRRREGFYWLTILFTFALGTASGDLMAESLGLGYLLTGTIVVSIIAAAAIAWRFGLNAILAFWIVYILTRPLGASMGDYLSQSKKYGGLGLGATETSVIFLSAILATVAYLSLSKRDQVVASTEPKVAPHQQRGAVLQLVAVIAVVVLGGGAGYKWRHDSFQNAVKEAPAASPIAKTGTTAATKMTTAGGAQPSPPATQVRPLGDLNYFKTLTDDTLALVLAGKWPKAKTRVTDLETAWDDAEASLKPMNPAKWHEMDGAIDHVLKQLRATQSDAARCTAALQALSQIIRANE